MSRTYITSKTRTFDIQKASNQNNQLNLTSELKKFLSNTNWVAAKYLEFGKQAKKLETRLKINLERIQNKNTKKIQQMRHLNTQCQDAWESEDIEKMVQKRNLILKQRETF